jgi:hypothetical protein
MVMVPRTKAQQKERDRQVIVSLVILAIFAFVVWQMQPSAAQKAQHAHEDYLTRAAAYYSCTLTWPGDPVCGTAPSEPPP